MDFLIAFLAWSLGILGIVCIGIAAGIAMFGPGWFTGTDRRHKRSALTGWR